jgi:hypothetical protein
LLAAHSRAFTTARPLSKAVRCRLYADGQRSGVDTSRPDRDGLRTDGHLGTCSVLVLHFRSDRLANVFGILFYTPILLCLPVLLLVGVLVCIPGGFILVLGGLYYALAWLFTSLLGLAVSRRPRAGASRVPPNTSSENAWRSGRSSFGSRPAIAARPRAFGLATDPTVGSAPNLELSRQGSDDVSRLASREPGSVPDRQDGTRAA